MIKKLLLLFILILPFNAFASIEETNLPVRVYVFSSEICPHCMALEETLTELKNDYPHLEIYNYEVTKNRKNAEYLYEARKLLNVQSSGVPFYVIGTKTFIGFSKKAGKINLIDTISVYEKADNYYDPVGELLEIVEASGTQTFEDLLNNDDNESVLIDVPFMGPVDVKTLSLPLLAIFIGAIDGFNPCALWVLLFLISFMLSINNRKRMFILGFAFIFTSALVYALFMVAWLNISILMTSIIWLRLLIALVALAGGVVNLRSYLKSKDDGCNVVNQTKRSKIIERIKEVVLKKHFILAILGIMVLAISVNFIEMACSAGLPLIFTNILALNNLNTISYAFYIGLYLLFFIIDDLIIFMVAMFTLKLKGASTKYVKYSHLIGGILMILIGLLLIFKPEWLAFNF